MRAASESVIEVSQCLAQDNAPCRHPSTVRVSFWTVNVVSIYLHKPNCCFSHPSCNFDQIQSDGYACLILKKWDIIRHKNGWPQLFRQREFRMIVAETPTSGSEFAGSQHPKLG